MRHYVIITGASSGIGESSTQRLIEAGYDVIAGVRTPKDADNLLQKFGANVHPVIMDVSDDESMLNALPQVKTILGDRALVSIICNAGIAINGAVLYIPVSEWQRQFEVNFFGVIRTIQTFFTLLIPLDKQDTHPRRIINISSVSGLFASPFLGPYASSKYALEALSDTLRRELYMYDIQVVLIQPGTIQTPIWKKAVESKSYMGPEYESIIPFKNKIIEKNLQQSLPVKAVTDKVLIAVTKKHVNNRYLVKYKSWKFLLIKSLPSAWVDKMIRKTLNQKSNIRPF